MQVNRLIVLAMMALAGAFCAVLFTSFQFWTPAAGATDASCPYSAIDQASINRTAGPAGATIDVNGHTPVRGAGGISVDFDGSTLAALPVDAIGNFNGSVNIPADAADGDHNVELKVDSCPAQRTILFAGDSVTEGAFASSAANTFVSRTLDGINLMPTGSPWSMQVYGVSGYGSLLLDDSFNNPLYQSQLTPPLFFSPRTWWKDVQPDLVVIEVGVNNLVMLDKSFRYDGTWRGYNGTDEAIAWWKTDITNTVNYLTSQKNLPADHILILGQWPYGGSDSYRGEMYVGGAGEAEWKHWNVEMSDTAAALGARFVPMEDVYGAGYIPDESEPGGDPEHLVDHEHGTSDVHPNDAGMQLFASRILDNLPADLGGAPMSFSFKVSSESPIEVKLRPAARNPFWNSYSDYLARLLSMNLTLANVGADNALGVTMNDSICTNGVICVTEFPASVGDIPAAGQGTVLLRYLVPPGENSFRVSFMASATDSGGWVHNFP